MPIYAKFLKKLLTNERKLEEVSIVTFRKGCLVVLTNKISKREKDPRSFIIPYLIRGVIDETTLFDLGASMNLKLCYDIGTYYAGLKQRLMLA